MAYLYSLQFKFTECTDYQSCQFCSLYKILSATWFSSISKPAVSQLFPVVKIWKMHFIFIAMYKTWNVKLTTKIN